MAWQGQAGDTAGERGRGTGEAGPTPSLAAHGAGHERKAAVAFPGLWLLLRGHREHPSSAHLPQFSSFPLLHCSDAFLPCASPSQPHGSRSGHRQPPPSPPRLAGSLRQCHSRASSPVGIIHTWSIPTSGAGSCGRNRRAEGEGGDPPREPQPPLPRCPVSSCRAGRG